MMSNTLSSPGLSYQMLNVKFAAIMHDFSVSRTTVQANELFC